MFVLGRAYLTRGDRITLTYAGIATNYGKVMPPGLAAAQKEEPPTCPAAS